MHRSPKAQRGFTLIELSIALVIIGLIVGGVLVGQNLIAAAGVRSTIAQIEKYNTAVNTFRGKYDALPGDINASLASQFGFVARGSARGEGDGNGVIEGVNGAFANGPTYEGAGESPMVWVDLSAAGLIDGTFNAASPNSFGWGGGYNSNVSAYLPAAKLDPAQFIYVWSGGFGGGNSINYFGMSSVTGIGFAGFLGYATLPVRTVASIDAKMDDGMPQSGNVTGIAVMATGGARWLTPSFNPVSAAHPVAASATSCYDNAGGSNAVATYTMSVNGGAGLNCALSFQFQ